MADWLKNALSKQQKQEDEEVAEKRTIEEKTTALRDTAVAFINNSGVYSIIAQYFVDIGDLKTVSSVNEAKIKRFIPLNICGYYGAYQPGLEYIDVHTEYEHDPDSGNIPHSSGSGDVFHSKIRTLGGTEICHVSIAVILKRDHQYVFVPIIVIAFSEGYGNEDENIFININPDESKLSDWFKEKTVLYLEKISSIK